MHKNFNMMKRYAIPLVKTFGSAALSNVRMNLSASHTRMLLSMTMLVMMLLAPSSVKGAVYDFNWQYWLNGATNAYLNASGIDTNCSGAIIMSGNDYDGIEGAQTVTRVQYRSKKNNGSYSTAKMEVNERLAFVLNTEGKANEYNGNNGWYLRAEPNGNSYYHRALYTGCWNSKLAILSLRGGDKVTFTFEAGDHVSDYGAGIHYNKSVHCHRGDNNDIYNNQNAYFESGQTIYITSSGDLIIDANIGTYITGIKIESEDVAKYKITTSGNTSTFEFTSNGVLDDNDFALPYLSFSMGSTDDYLLVQNLEAHMIKANGTEDLVTGNAQYQPSAGSFYAFKPTANGTITINEGSIQGGQIHVFVYNPAKNGVDYNWEMNNGNFYKHTFTSLTNFSFQVEKGKTYYICQDNQHESGNALHLKKFTFTTTFYVRDLGVVINDVDKQGDNIALTPVDPAGGYELKVKRCSANISPAMSAFIQNGWLYMSKPSFVEGTDHAGTVIWDLVSDGGSAAIVVTFPYSAAFNDVDNPDPNRTYGHTWNFIDPRNSDSNIGNCLIRTGLSSFDPGTISGILSIGQHEDHSSQLYLETEQREWVYAERQTGSSGGFHDPMYKNVYDMVGDNADMIWETEGLIFETSPNLSCIWNETDARDQDACNPLNFASPGETDPDRYVGIMPPVQSTDFSSFTIPGLKPGDRVLIFMKSGESSGDNGIFLNITGAKDALGKQIEATDLYKAGGTNWQHNRYEGCYHFIKDDTTDPGSEYGRITFDMQAGSMCKLLYIHIYTGERIVTTNIVSQTTDDAGKLLFINDKGAELGSAGSASQMSLRFRGKGQNSIANVLTYSGSLNANSFTGDYFKVSGKYNHLLDFTSKVGEMGMFRLRMNDVTYEYERTSNQKITYVADFCDRNFTVGYRDKVDSYPYTWDFTDIQGFSSDKMTAEANNYPIAAAANDAYGYEWDISLFDADGNMKVNTGCDPITNNLIFSPHKIGNGNQLWAGGDVIPETRGLWFYSEDDSETGYTSEYSSSLYNDCLQITDEGIRFANVPDDARKRVAWWNYKMVVPDVPADGAVYLRMKRDTSVPDDAKTFSTIDNADVPFLATRFQFASEPAKTQLSTDTEVKGNGNYAFYKVDGSTDEWILAVKNTGSMQHLTFTLNGWIVKKVAVSTDQKSVNVKGWTTESRDHVIDPELTAYMTGKDIETCLVTDVDYDNKTVTLTRMDNTQVMTKLANGEKGANIIHNKANEEVKILNNGFHLFVPDMHDYDKANDANGEKTITGKTSMLIAQVSNTNGAKSIPASSTKDGVNYTNYALTYKYYKLDENGNKTGSQIEGDEAFYRIATGGASSSGNQGYLPLLTSEVKPKDNGTSAKYGFTFVFEDYQEIPTEVLAPETFETSERVENNVFYNLNGQKLNGLPTKSGLYIMNGKKVIIK
jgi:hypothetical protein